MNAVLGAIVCTQIKHRGIAGLVVDGVARDMPGIGHLDFPIFARRTTLVGPLHRGPGEVNCAISCGGAAINPGDVIVADISGIVVIPRESAEYILRRFDSQKAHQETYLAAVGRGELSNGWVDALLRQHECPICDGKVETHEVLGPSNDAL